MCFEKVPCMALYIEKMGVWNGSQMMWDSFQTSNLMQKLSFHSFWNPSMRFMPMYVYACMELAYVDLEHPYAYTCLRTHDLGFPWPYFLKIDLFSS